MIQTETFPSDGHNISGNVERKLKTKKLWKKTIKNQSDSMKRRSNIQIYHSTQSLNSYCIWSWFFSLLEYETTIKA